MIGAWTSERVRAAETAALAATPEGALMQRAAAGIATVTARLLRERRGRVTGRRVVLLVGAGGNGGDALWAGARLARRGAQVHAVLLADEVHRPGLAAARAAGVRVLPVAEAAVVAPGVLNAADVVIDGIVGLGARPGLRPPADVVVAAIPAGAAVVAVDLPSGVDPDTGATPLPHVRADVTVALAAAKPGLLLPPASVAAGRVEVLGLGIDTHLDGPPLVERVDGADVAARWPVPAPGDDKYRRGVLGVVAGSAGYPGAAVLTCAGALRAGVGMVRYLGPRDATAAVLAAWPEVVAGGGRVQAWVLGPGVAAPTADDGRGDESRDDDSRDDDGQPAAVRAALGSGLPCVVDAGALALATPDLLAGGAARVLLTPHAGELARLLGVERSAVETRPYEHAALAARRTGATVLLKGATTLVVGPDGRAHSQAEGPPWLATAGAGDVLAGIAGALLAAGLSAPAAGAVAAHVHGAAAARAARGGPIVAADVAAALPATVAALLTGRAGSAPPNG